MEVDHEENWHGRFAWHFYAGTCWDSDFVDDFFSDVSVNLDVFDHVAFIQGPNKPNILNRRPLRRILRGEGRGAAQDMRGWVQKLDDVPSGKRDIGNWKSTILDSLINSGNIQ